MSETRWQIDTRLIHAGDPRPGVEGAVVLPIFQSATFGHAGEGEYDDVRYTRLNNTPNHIALAKKLASLEGAESALVTASGMAAISTALVTRPVWGHSIFCHRRSAAPGDHRRPVRSGLP